MTEPTLRHSAEPPTSHMFRSKQPCDDWPTYRVEFMYSAENEDAAGELFDAMCELLYAEKRVGWSLVGVGPVCIDDDESPATTGGEKGTQ